MAWCLRLLFRAVLAVGFLFVAALWGTLKAAYYGLVFPAALAADLFPNRRGREGYLLGIAVIIFGTASPSAASQSNASLQ